MVYGYGSLVGTTIVALLVAGAAVSIGIRPTPWATIMESIEGFASEGDLIVLADEDWRYRLIPLASRTAVATGTFLPEMLEFPRIFVVSHTAEPSALESLGVPLWSESVGNFRTTLIQVPAEANIPFTAHGLEALLWEGSCGDAGKGTCGISILDGQTDDATCVTLTAETPTTIVLPAGYTYAGWFKPQEDAFWQGEALTSRQQVAFIIPAADTSETVTMAGTGCLRLHRLSIDQGPS